MHKKNNSKIPNKLINIWKLKIKKRNIFCVLSKILFLKLKLSKRKNNVQNEGELLNVQRKIINKINIKTY